MMLPRRRRRRPIKPAVALLVLASCVFNVLLATRSRRTERLDSYRNDDDPRRSSAAAAAGASPAAPLSASDTESDADADAAEGMHQPANSATGTDAVVDSLLRLALDVPPPEASSLPTARIRAPQLTVEGEMGLFQLPALRRGECPWPQGKRPDWLPYQPPRKTAALFRRRERGDNGEAPGDEDNSSPVVAVYYEHLSKAGGTSFCKLARANMDRWEVPNYMCMPPDPDNRSLKDGRVGTWPADKLGRYLSKGTHRIVSNEWSAFNPDLLDAFQEWSGHGSRRARASLVRATGGSLNGAPLMLFVTSVRHPIDRLLSAHKFFAPKDQGSEEPNVSLGGWIERLAKRRGGFRKDVARSNFAVWKFSGGKLERSSWEDRAEKVLLRDGRIGDGSAVEETLRARQGGEKGSEAAWAEPFRIAVRTLARYDLVIPTELLSDNTGPLRDVLGWDNFEKSHVVSAGKVRNNDASAELSAEQYAVLWEANWLDMILYAWISAVYLSRVNCPEISLH